MPCRKPNLSRKHFPGLTLKDLNILTRHKILTYVGSFLGIEIFLAPVLTIFFMKYEGLSFKDYASYEAVVFLLSAFLQVPLGAVADSYGRKKFLVIAKSIYLAGMVLLVIAPSKTVIWLSALLFSIGTALGTGNQEAIVYEVFKKENALSEFQHLLEKSSAIRLFSGAVACILGAWIATYNLALPMAIDSAFLFICILFTVALLADDNKMQLFDHVNFKGLRKGWEVFSQGAKTLMKDPKITLLFLAFACASAIIRGTFITYQPLLLDYKVSLGNLGIIFAALGFISAFFSYLPSKIEKKHKTLVKYGAALIGVALTSALVCGLSTTYIGILFALALQQVFRGLYGPFYDFQTNDHIRPGHPSRTTLLSVSSFLSMILCSVSFLLIGRLTQHYSQSTAFVLNSTIFAFSMGLFLICYIALDRFSRTQKERSPSALPESES